MKEGDKLILYLLCGLVFLFLALLCMLKFKLIFPAIDKGVSSYFFFHQANSGVLLMKSISFLASVPFMIVFSFVVLGFFCFSRRYRNALFYFVNVVFGFAIEEFVKIFIKRVRPVNPFESDFSFPSGHSMISLLAYWSLAYIFWNVNRKVSYFLAAVPLIVGFSRIYLNVHWLSDIIGGYLLGGFLFVFSIWLFFDKKYFS
jgi:undecaprenyl-diphosphatase